jgi:hypothetical protein
VGSSVEPVLALVLRARRRLTAACLAEAAAAPIAVLLLAAAALLAVSRWTGRADLPGGAFRAAALLAGLAVAARLLRGLPRTADAALHLDRTLGAGERFSTVLETASTDPALAEWAARGALARAGGDALGRALAFRPPAALLPLLLASVLAAGLALLPGAPAAAGESPAGAVDGAPAASGSGGATAGGPASTGAPAARVPAVAVPADPRETVRLLEEEARAEGNDGALRALASARDALARGETAEAREHVRRALEAMGRDGADPAAGGGVIVPGATGGGVAAGGAPAAGAPSGEAPFRPFPVPLRAREAVKAYFGDGGR